MIDCSCDLPVTNCIIAFHLPDSSSKPSWSQTANKKRSNIIVSLHLFKWQAHMDVSENSGFSPQIIHFNRVFHSKPSILGYHYFWKHPCIFTYYTFGLFFFSGKSTGKRGISMDRMGRIEFPHLERHFSPHGVLFSHCATRYGLLVGEIHYWETWRCEGEKTKWASAASSYGKHGNALEV